MDVQALRQSLHYAGILHLERFMQHVLAVKLCEDELVELVEGDLDPNEANVARV